MQGGAGVGRSQRPAPPLSARLDACIFPAPHSGAGLCYAGCSDVGARRWQGGDYPVCTAAIIKSIRRVSDMNRSQALVDRVCGM